MMFRGLKRTLKGFQKIPIGARSISSRILSQNVRVNHRSSIAFVTGIGAFAIIGYKFNSQSSIYLDRKVKPEELAIHKNQENGIWVVIEGKVYDLTEFLSMHPGGTAIILKYAGKDASFLFNKIHPKDTLQKMLPEGAYIGELDGEIEEDEDPLMVEERNCEEMRDKRPPLISILNLSDFEFVAKKVIPSHAWSYYIGGSDDEVTLRENGAGFSRYYFNPKVLVDVEDTDISTTMLGTPTDAPFYCSAAALALLGHPDGELSIARGLFEENIIQMISSAASYPLDEIIDETEGPKWFQLYVKPNRNESMNTIKHCIGKKIKAIAITLDTPIFGNRTSHQRYNISDDVEDIEALDVVFKKKDDFLLTYGKIKLKWQDIKDFKEKSSIPIVLKGIQRVEDVLLAIENNADAVILSNHGGRQLDYSRPPIDVLAELMPILREKHLEDKIEIYIDGGIRRGTDVLKALALGARGVGLGRSFLFANASYGENGVIKCCRILKEEIRRDMQLLGVKSIDELTPDLIHQYPAVFSAPTNKSYEGISLPKFKEF